MFLRFVRHGSKWYAQTPLGEYAYGDRSGLTEWTRDRSGRALLVRHTGGDQQAGPCEWGWTDRVSSLNQASVRGLAAATNPIRQN